jgi:hypothetical protein
MIVGFAVVGSLILTSCGNGLLIAKRLRHITWSHCPETPAVVHLGCLMGDRSRHVGLVIYTYKVAGQTHYGTCKRSFTTPRGALHFIEHCKASQLLARYKPENAEESCLFECEQAEIANQFVEQEKASIN